MTADFELNKEKAVGTPVTWKKCNWKVPPQAVEKVSIDKKKDRVRIKIFFDQVKMNTLLANDGLKKMKKTERTFLFGNLPSARDFLFHLRRIHHLHNSVIAKNPDAKILVIEDLY